MLHNVSERKVFAEVCALLVAFVEGMLVSVIILMSKMPL